MVTRMLVFVVAAVGLSACNGPNGTPATAENSSTAQTSSATETTAPAGTPPAGELKFSGENSKIEFKGTKNRGSPNFHNGGFQQFTGTIDWPGDDFTQAKIHVEIDLNSTYTDNAKVTQHLKNPDFFEVARYPQASFVSTSIKPSTASGATHEITGDLTLHGVTKPVTFPARVMLDAEGLTLTGAFTIQRLEYNINYRPDYVDNDVTMRLTVRATK